MLIGDFSRHLADFIAHGSFGIEELNRHFKGLDKRLATLGSAPAERMFHILLSFLLNQGTEWDVFGVPNQESHKLYPTLGHGRYVVAPFDTSAEMIVLHKPPVSRRVIELVPSFQAVANPIAIRAPAACFLAYSSLAIFFKHALDLRRNRHDGQAYGFLLSMELAEVDNWLSRFQPMFEPFQIRFWLNAQGERGESFIVTLITTDLAHDEI